MIVADAPINIMVMLAASIASWESAYEALNSNGIFSDTDITKSKPKLVLGI